MHPWSFNGSCRSLCLHETISSSFGKCNDKDINDQRYLTWNKCKVGCVGANTIIMEIPQRNWIILLNIINLKRKITQHYLDWSVALALFKEIQALGWLNFVTDIDLLWLVSPKIHSPTSVVWLEQPLHKVFKPKTPPERTPFLAKNLSIFFFFFDSFPFLIPPPFTSLYAHI